MTTAATRSAGTGSQARQMVDRHSVASRAHAIPIAGTLRHVGVGHSMGSVQSSRLRSEGFRDRTELAAGAAGGQVDSANVFRQKRSFCGEAVALDRLAPPVHQPPVMTSKPADAFGKQVLFDALTLAGAKTVIGEEVQHAPQLIDVFVAEPPRRRAVIGVLGPMTNEACLLEAFSSAPSLEDVRSCQRKQFAVHQRNRLLRERRLRSHADVQPVSSGPRPHRSDIPPPRDADLPRLYILAAGRPRSVIRRFHLRCASFCAPGFYFSTSVHALCLVVLDELVRDRSTLPLRLLGRAGTLQSALRDALSLPATDPLKKPLFDAITNRRHRLMTPGHVPTPEDEEFHMTLDEEIRMIRAQGVDEGRQIGTAEGRQIGTAEGRQIGTAEGRQIGAAEGQCTQARRSLMRILNLRGFVPTELERATIHNCQDLALLESWIDRAIDGTSLDRILAPSSPDQTP